LSDNYAVENNDTIFILLHVFDFFSVPEKTDKILIGFIAYRKKAARLILDRESKAPSLPLFQDSGWLPIHDRIKFVRATIVFKALNGLSPSYISDVILPFNKVHNINTRGSTSNLKLLKANTNSGKALLLSSLVVNGTRYRIMLKPHHHFPRSKGTILRWPSPTLKTSNSLYSDAYIP